MVTEKGKILMKIDSIIAILKKIENKESKNLYLLTVDNMKSKN